MTVVLTHLLKLLSFVPLIMVYSVECLRKIDEQGCDSHLGQVQFAIDA